jgi:aerobic carbon-monoxide dehydrogenase medium subunit
MKPSKFEYARPASIAEAVALVSEADGESALLAGGQSLVPRMNLRVVAPRRIIDLGGVTELRYVEPDGDQVRIGAMTTQESAERSPIVKEAAPILAHALRFVGYRATRSRGTLGGSACHADPTAELPVVLQALGAQLVARGPAGERAIAADDFFASAFTTTLREDELLVELRIPAAGARRWWFREVSRRRGGVALVSVAMVGSDDGAPPRIVLGGMGPAPVRASRAERLLADGADAQREAARAAVAATKPPSDVHASAATRRHIAENLVRRGMAEVTG